MNVSKSFERALSIVLRQYATLVSGTTIRTFQNLAQDYELQRTKGLRDYPQIDIRCSPTNTDDNQHTFSIDAVLSMATNVEDDKLNQQISTLYDAVQQVLDSLLDQFYGTSGGELELLKSSLSEDLGDGFNFGGISLSGGSAPYDDDGINVIQQTIRLHYTRS